MSIIRDIFARKTLKNYSLADFNKDIQTALRGHKVLSGVNVNEETAKRFTAVFASIKILSETLAMLPLGVFKKRENGGKDKAREHNLHNLLHDTPNEEMPSFTFRETLQNHLVSSGNCYSLIEQNRRGQITKMVPVPWTLMEPRRNPETKKLEFLYNDRGKIETLPYDMVFHVPGLGFDGIKGYSPIKMAQEAVGIGLAAEAFGAMFYGNGTHLGGVLESPQSLSDPAYKRLKESFEEKYKGLGKAHEVILLEEGTKFTKMGIPPEEAQFLETRKFQIQEIARIYRIPLHMLQDLDRSTNNNIEHQSLEFVKYTMLPWIVRWEQYINFRLFTKQEREQGYFAEFNVDGLLRGDAKTRAEALNLQRQNGVITGNEWRGFENYNPAPPEVGDVYLVNGNMISVEMAGKQTKPNESGEGGDKGNG